MDPITTVKQLLLDLIREEKGHTEEKLQAFWTPTVEKSYLQNPSVEFQTRILEHYRNFRPQFQKAHWYDDRDTILIKVVDREKGKWVHLPSFNRKGQTVASMRSYVFTQVGDAEGAFFYTAGRFWENDWPLDDPAAIPKGWLYPEALPTFILKPISTSWEKTAHPKRY